MSKRFPSPALLLVGGTDSSGGAGITRDTQAATALGTTARPVVTAITAQAKGTPIRVFPLSKEALLAGLHAALQPFPPAAVKTGMLWNAETVRTLASFLQAHLPNTPLIVDPVQKSSNGDTLLNHEGHQALIDMVATHPGPTTVMPNLPEAASATGLAPETPPETLAQAARNTYRANLLWLTGGHGEADILTDLLCAEEGTTHIFQATRQHPTRPLALRGTGCRLASAFAACIARGMAPEEAAQTAHSWLQRDIASN